MGYAGLYPFVMRRIFLILEFWVKTNYSAWNAKQTTTMEILREIWRIQHIKKEDKRKDLKIVRTH